ncbi:FecCD family ABC transporter permease [Paracoccus sp. (in: a-proteobacteria)]|uniref:FecCD family ABC transporter permease n=1 Tax=Paracoccus sp. TaxID=267 RepID=UPI0035B3E8E3
MSDAGAMAMPLVAGDRSRSARRLSGLLVLALICASVASLSSGASDTSLGQVLRDLLAGQGIGARDRIVLVDIRLPRLIMGGLIGAALAVSGALLQGLFRNPLADPGIVGVSAGAGLGAVSAIVLGGLLPFATGSWLVPLAAFAGAWVSTMLLYRVATRQGRTSVATMLLAGIALGAMTSALTGILVYFADDTQLRDFTFWTMGSLAGAGWAKLAIAAPLLLITLCAAPLLASGLNGLALGEAAAGHIGIAVQRVKALAVLTVALATGTSVALSGGIGFVGIIVPHLLRLISGPDHRHLLPNAALLGATVLILADMVSRAVIAPAELPIGIVTAVTGGPFFLWVLLRNRALVDL